MTVRLRWLGGLLGLALVTALGTVAFVIVEGAAPFDAFYMVMITISTVGFGEVFPLSHTGRMLTIFVMVTGVGLAFYTAAAGIEHLFLIGTQRRLSRLTKMIGALSDHVVLCGLGRVGTGTLRALEARSVDVVAIESDPVRVEEARSEGIIVLEGDATHNEALIAAGIANARALVACVTDDADNLVIVLSARSLVEDLHIVSRASEAEWEDKLRLAGANRVVAPQVVGSERLAAMTVEQNLADVFDVVVGGRTIEFAVEEFEITPGSPLVGLTVQGSSIREKTGATVLAVEDRTRKILTTPAPTHVFEAHSLVIVVGTPDQVEAASTLFRP